MSQDQFARTFAENWTSLWLRFIKFVGKWSLGLAAAFVGMVALSLFIMLPGVVYEYLTYGAVFTDKIDGFPYYVWAVIGAWIVFWGIAVVAAIRAREQINTQSNQG